MTINEVIERLQQLKSLGMTGEERCVLSYIDPNPIKCTLDIDPSGEIYQWAQEKIKSILTVGPFPNGQFEISLSGLSKEEIENFQNNNPLYKKNE